MTNKSLNRVVFNAITGEKTIIELTAAEVAELQAQAVIAETQRQELEAAQAAKAIAAASAVAKLEAIGLTTEEIAALRG